MGRYWVRGRGRVRVRASVRVRFKVVFRNVVVVKRENQRWIYPLSTFIHQLTLDHVLDFIYTGECPLNLDTAEDMLKAANLFQLSALQDMVSPPS